jgi:photosystem II stability/assembly factor-like uncharacterized protein
VLAAIAGIATIAACDPRTPAPVDSSITSPQATPTTAPSPAASPAASAIPVAGLPAAPTNITTMAWLDEQTALFAGAAGDTGVLWRTTDHGKTWTPTPVGFGGVDDIAVVGSDIWLARACPLDPEGPCTNGVEHSSDAGRTWAQLSAQPFLSVSFGDRSHGWGVAPAPLGGTTPAVFRTADAGGTWTPIQSLCGFTGEPVAVSFPTPTRGWLACDSDLGAGSAVKGIWETTDGGAHWVVRSSAVFPGEGQSVGSIGGGGYLHDLRMTAGGRGLTWFGRGGAARTLDGGVDWTGTSDIDVDVIIPFAGWVLDETHWFLLITDADVGGATILEETTNAGKTWARVLTLP